jgi:hypothetical protein
VGIIPGAQGGSSQEQAFYSDPDLRRELFRAFGQSHVLACAQHRWLANAIRICKKRKMKNELEFG